MTKRLRLENADTSDHKVVVQLFDKSQDGSPDTLFEEFEIHPIELRELTVWDTRYIVIKEVSKV